MIENCYLEPCVCFYLPTTHWRMFLFLSEVKLKMLIFLVSYLVPYKNCVYMQPEKCFYHTFDKHILAFILYFHHLYLLCTFFCINGNASFVLLFVATACSHVLKLEYEIFWVLPNIYIRNGRILPNNIQIFYV